MPLKTSMGARFQVVEVVLTWGVSSAVNERGRSFSSGGGGGADVGSVVSCEKGQTPENECDGSFRGLWVVVVAREGSISRKRA